MAFSASLQETPHSCPGCGCITTGPWSSCTEDPTSIHLHSYSRHCPYSNQLRFCSGESQSRWLSPLPLWIRSLEPFQVQFLSSFIHLPIRIHVCAWENQSTSLHQVYSETSDRKPTQGSLWVIRTNGHDITHSNIYTDTVRSALTTKSPYNCVMLHNCNITSNMPLLHTYAVWPSWSLAPPPGEPTLEEKAQKAIEQLGLGERSDGALGRPSPKGGRLNITTPIRQRRAAGLPIACPASQSEKSVCSDITGKQRATTQQLIEFT